MNSRFERGKSMIFFAESVMASLYSVETNSAMSQCVKIVLNIKAVCFAVSILPPIKGFNCLVDRKTDVTRR
ncbi:hypothetical protein L2729_04360 [Shewanella gelidimarina]|uniref:hypothetical protein n=1 Tax=Shewanella gelidimarina TaxID=56813 RepID=UPI00200E963D|nr:hypothetical protein [Shewanella gelidimarina]MCL1057226.1 hypothetical protein [Shewanella gelidimarina]